MRSAKCSDDVNAGGVEVGAAEHDDARKLHQTDFAESVNLCVVAGVEARDSRSPPLRKPASETRRISPKEGLIEDITPDHEDRGVRQPYPAHAGRS